MEEIPTYESAYKGQEPMSYQRRMWKHFQDKTKPFLSPKLGSERRGADSKKETGLWMFKRKKKDLDRVFSSSQPNLSSTPPGGSGDSVGTDISEHPVPPPRGADDGATGSRTDLPGHGRPNLLVTQLIMSQQKSCSLGSECFQKLVVECSGAGQQEPVSNKSVNE
ncbi:hypothetical protein DPEC_G00125110 [Dallia pectoralis]|uniref:Uncharacterized protein n=1 Tax=Dallia pectoralis TaxID=75939 RepID=A0ACC2GR42_DALPE|nr:hypothetical protein DPEC_G00125110 [Dallia pectoralis]